MSDGQAQWEEPVRREPPWALLAAGGGAGLALYLGLSLWVFMRQVGPSLRIEYAAHWQQGTRTPLRVELRDDEGRSAPIHSAQVQVTLAPRAANQGASSQGPRKSFSLPVYEMRKGRGGTRAQGMIEVPREWPKGPSQLLFSLAAKGQAQVLRSCEVEIHPHASSQTRAAVAVAAAQFVQESDPSDAQPQGARLEMRSRGLLRASLPSRFWVRATDERGRPLPGQLRVRKVTGEFRVASTGEAAPKDALLLADTIPATGLLAFEGTLLSEQFGVEIEVLAALPRSGRRGKGARAAKPKVVAQRKVFLRAFPGASSLEAQRLGAKLRTRYRSLVGKRRASIDIFDSDGRWVALLDPPSWPDSGWVDASLSELPPGILQLEAYSGVRTVQPSVPAAQIWHPGQKAGDGLKPLLAQTRSRLARWPKEERDATRGYLDHIEQTPWSGEQRETIVQWLLETLPAGRFAAPLVHDTRKSAQAELEAFRERWKTRLRFLLWGGYLVYAGLVSWILARHQQRRRLDMAQASDELMELGVGLWLRMAGVLVVTTLCVWLLGRLMESLV